MAESAPNTQSKKSSSGCSIFLKVALILLILFIIFGVGIWFAYKKILTQLETVNANSAVSSLNDVVKNIEQGSTTTDATLEGSHLNITRDDIQKIATDAGYPLTFEQWSTGGMSNYSAVTGNNTIVVIEDTRGIFSVTITTTGEPTIDSNFLMKLATAIDPKVNTNDWLNKAIKENESATQGMAMEEKRDGYTYMFNYDVIMYDDGSVYQKQMSVSINGTPALQ